MAFSNKHATSLLAVALLLSVIGNAAMAGYLLRDPASIVERHCIDWGYLDEDQIQFQLLDCKLMATLTPSQYETLLPGGSWLIHSFMEFQTDSYEARTAVIRALLMNDLDSDALAAALEDLRIRRLQFMELADAAIAGGAANLDEKGREALAEVYRRNIGQWEP